MSLSGYASTHILYNQGFEYVSSPYDTGWSFGGRDMRILSDEFGKHLDLSLGYNDGRSGQVTWGRDIFFDDNGNSILEDGIYTIKFDFCIKRVPTDKVGSGITIFTNHQPIINQGYRLPSNNTGVWDNFIVNIEQTNTTANASADMTVAFNAPIKEIDNEDGTIAYAIDNSNEVATATDIWYTVVGMANVNSRIVEYNVYSINGDSLTNGKWTVPETNANGEAISMYAEGMYVMMSKYFSNFLIDNIQITCEKRQGVTVNIEPFCVNPEGGTALKSLKDIELIFSNITYNLQTASVPSIELYIKNDSDWQLLQKGEISISVNNNETNPTIYDIRFKKVTEPGEYQVKIPQGVFGDEEFINSDGKSGNTNPEIILNYTIAKDGIKEGPFNLSPKTSLEQESLSSITVNLVMIKK